MMKASIPAFAIPARSRVSRASKVATGNSSAFHPHQSPAHNVTPPR
jgi:hypothetical protein